MPGGRPLVGICRRCTDPKPKYGPPESSLCTFSPPQSRISGLGFAPIIGIRTTYFPVLGCRHDSRRKSRSPSPSPEPSKPERPRSPSPPPKPKSKPPKAPKSPSPPLSPRRETVRVIRYRARDLERDNDQRRDTHSRRNALGAKGGAKERSESKKETERPPSESDCERKQLSNIGRDHEGKKIQRSSQREQHEKPCNVATAQTERNDYRRTRVRYESSVESFDHEDLGRRQCELPSRPRKEKIVVHRMSGALPARSAMKKHKENDNQVQNDAEAALQSAEEERLRAELEAKRRRDIERRVAAHPNAFAHGRLIPVDEPESKIIDDAESDKTYAPEPSRHSEQRRKTYPRQTSEDDVYAECKVVSGGNDKTRRGEPHGRPSHSRERDDYRNSQEHHARKSGQTSLAQDQQAQSSCDESPDTLARRKLRATTRDKLRDSDREWFYRRTTRRSSPRSPSPSPLRRRPRLPYPEGQFGPPTPQPGKKNLDPRSYNPTASPDKEENEQSTFGRVRDFLRRRSPDHDTPRSDVKDRGKTSISAIEEAAGDRRVRFASEDQSDKRGRRREEKRDYCEAEQDQAEYERRKHHIEHEILKGSPLDIDGASEGRHQVRGDRLLTMDGTYEAESDGSLEFDTESEEVVSGRDQEDERGISRSTPEAVATKRTIQ